MENPLTDSNVARIFNVALLKHRRIDKFCEGIDWVIRPANKYDVRNLVRIERISDRMHIDKK